MFKDAMLNMIYKEIDRNQYNAMINMESKGKGKYNAMINMKSKGIGTDQY